MTEVDRHNLKQVQVALYKAYNNEFEDEAEKDLELEIAISRISFILEREPIEKPVQATT